MLLTVAQAAERLAVRPSTIRSWLSKGLLPRTKCGRCTRISSHAIDAFIVGPYDIGGSAIWGGAAWR
jgi:excisionase family DNA binding protein